MPVTHCHADPQRPLCLETHQGVIAHHARWCSLLQGANLTIDETKFLGGDVEHTHLVKGLDYALLQKACCHPVPTCTPPCITRAALGSDMRLGVHQIDDNDMCHASQRRRLSRLCM